MQAIVLHKYKILGFTVIILAELGLAYQFYSREPEFPVDVFQMDVTNSIVRDICLGGLALLAYRYRRQIACFCRECRPIAIVGSLWLIISLLIIHSLNLLFNSLTVLAMLTGIINNGIILLFAAYLYSHWNNIAAKTAYFITYILTLLLFYSDTIYFFVTSTHIKRIVFANLNSHSVTGVLSTADAPMLAGVLGSFCLLLFLFRTPKRPDYLRHKNLGAIAFTVCLLANVLNVTLGTLYPQLLLADGYYEEGEIEKARKVSRELLAESVTLNLARELLHTEESQMATASQLQHIAFSQKETRLLRELGINTKEKSAPFPSAYPYERIIVIVAESFHRDYLHYYNPQIPTEASAFIDSLIAKYPHSDHYYTSHPPTTQGLNAMFLSQVLYSESQVYDTNPSLFRSFEKQGYKTMFLESTSQYFNDEFRAYRKRFGMANYKAREDMERQGYTGSSGWGFHNDAMYEETLKIIEQNRNNKLFLVTKTIDSHQPYPYCGFTKEEMPPSIEEAPKNMYLKAIYWENATLQKFFQELEARNLLDDKTLVIFTADHNPHPSQHSNYKRLGQAELGVSPAPIPLIFVSRNLEPFDDFSPATYAAQLDFAPTLLGLVGLPIPPEFAGRNMLMVDPDSSYALGCIGETLHYWSNDVQLQADMYTGKNLTDVEKAVIHWVEDGYVRYVSDGPARQRQAAPPQ